MFWCVSTSGNDSIGAPAATQALAELTPYLTYAAVEAATGTVLTTGDTVLWNGISDGLQLIETSGIAHGIYGASGGVYADTANNALTMANISDLTFTGMDMSGGVWDGSFAITVVVSGDGTTDNNIVFNYCHVHDAAPTEIAIGDGHGFHCTSAGVSIADCLINHFPNDGIYIDGNDCEVSYCTIYDVDRSLTYQGGDCVKLSSSGAATNGYVHHNILDHTDESNGRNAGRKSALIIIATGTGIIAEHNWCSGGERVITASSPEVIIRRNLTHPLPPDLNSVPAITTTFGIRVSADDVVVESNIIDSSVGGACSILLSIIESDNCTAQGNIIYGPVEEGGSGIKVNDAAGNFSANAIIRNNIIGGLASEGANFPVIINVSAGSSIAYCDYNIYLNDGFFTYQGTSYSSLALWQAGTGFDTNSVIIDKDVLFRDAANGDFRIVAGQEIAGLQLNYKDFLGRVNHPTIIGAYIQQAMLAASSGAVTSAAGSVTSTAGSVSSGAVVGGKSVYGDAVKYPEWGIR